MRLTRPRKRERAADDGPHGAVFERGLQRGVGRRQFRCRHAEQERAEDGRLADHRVARINLDRSAAADDDDASAAGHEPQIDRQVPVREHLDDDIDAAAAGELHHLLFEIRIVVVERMAGALLAYERPPGLRAGGPDHGEPGGVRQLHSGGARASARAMHQEGLSRDGPRDLKERAEGRDVRNANRRSLLETRRRRQPVRLGFGARDRFRVGSRPRAADVHAVARDEPCDVTSGGNDRPGPVDPRCVGQIRFHRMCAAADVRVDRVHAGRVDAHDHLPGAGPRLRNLFENHVLRSAEAMYPDCPHSRQATSERHHAAGAVAQEEHRQLIPSSRALPATVCMIDLLVRGHDRVASQKPRQ